MGVLKGELSVMSLPDAIIWLANRQRTGKLTVARGGVHKVAYISDGLVIQSSSDDPRERLGQHLMNFGYVTETQLQVAFQTQTETGVPLGRVLMMGDVLDEERLQKVLNYKTRECILDAFEWEQGSFEFSSEDVRNEALDAPTPTHLAEIHSEGTSRRAMWAEIHKLLPGPQHQLDVLQALPPTLNSFDRRLLEFATLGRSIGEIALEVRALDFHVFARLYDLAARGMVRAREPGKRAVPRAVPPPLPPEVLGAAVVPAAREELLGDLRARLGAGDHDAAYVAANRVLERDPNNVEALAALKVVQSRPQPASTLSTAAVPRLCLSREQLEEYLLTSKERYVLSRVDGKRSLGQIIQVSPIQELELMRIVEAFVQRGMVAL